MRESMEDIDVDSQELMNRLRELWHEARTADQTKLSVEEVFDRLKRKYQPMVDTIEREQGKLAADRVRSRLAHMKSYPLAVQQIKEHNSGIDPRLILEEVDVALREVRDGKDTKPEGQEGSNILS